MARTKQRNKKEFLGARTASFYASTRFITRALRHDATPERARLFFESLDYRSVVPANIGILPERERGY